MDRPFSQKTLDFLFENRLHDSREWFAQHKKEYQELVIQPLRQLVMDLSPTMLELDPEFNTEPKVDKTICRVWRDTRYTKDPSLYRDHMWILFKRGGRMHGTDHPGMYVEINQDGFSYGCGFYYASTAYMSCLRERILAGDGAFQAAQEAYLGQKVFSMEGDCYKRPRYGHRSPRSSCGWSGGASALPRTATTSRCCSPHSCRGSWPRICACCSPCTGFWNPPPRRSCAARRSRGFGRGDRSPIPRKGRGWLLFSQKFR